MPPKKKKKEPIVINNVEITDISREKLEEFVHCLKEELDREREERNFFQLERDKLQTFWEITRQQLEEGRAKIKNKERDIEESKENLKLQLQHYDQRVKHLLYLQECNLAEMKGELTVILENTKSDHIEVEKEILKEKKELKAQLLEQELAGEEEIRQLKEQQCEELLSFQEMYKEKLRKMEEEYLRRLAVQDHDLNIKHKMELTEVLERKNEHIKQLKENHHKMFQELNDYYNRVTLNNFALISSIKTQMKELKNREVLAEKEMRKIQKVNKKLVLPLQEAQAAVADLTRRMNNYEKDKTSFKNTQSQLKSVVSEKESLLLDHEKLFTTFNELQNEVNELKEKFIPTVMDIQKYKEAKNFMLENKLNKTINKLEKMEKNIRQMIEREHLDPAAAAAVNKKLEDLLSHKNTAIKCLQYELCRISKAHDDLLETYESKLQQYGIPKEEMGFTLLHTNVHSHGPAGLVTKNL